MGMTCIRLGHAENFRKCHMIDANLRPVYMEVGTPGR